MRKRLRRMGDRGAAIVEYALLLGLIAVVCAAAIAFVGNSTSSTLNNGKLTAGLSTASTTTTTTAAGHDEDDDEDEVTTSTSTTRPGPTTTTTDPKCKKGKPKKDC